MSGKWIVNPHKERVVAAIREHLTTHGSTGWKEHIINRFPEVSEATIFRWIREVRQGETSKPELSNAKAKLQQKIKGVRNERAEEARRGNVEDIARHIPAAPSPAYIAKTGAEGLANIDFVVEIKRLYADAEMLRAYAIKATTAEDGTITEKIQNPIAFDKSIARRANLLETAIKTVQEIWDLRQMQQFYEIVIEEVGAADSATQRRILERLAELNARVGMTMGMRV